MSNEDAIRLTAYTSIFITVLVITKSIFLGLGLVSLVIIIPMIYYDFIKDDDNDDDSIYEDDNRGD